MQHSANVDDCGAKGECTPLMEAASGGYAQLCMLLLSHGADVNAASSNGNGLPYSFICVVLRLNKMEVCMVKLIFTVNYS